MKSNVSQNRSMVSVSTRRPRLSVWLQPPCPNDGAAADTHSPKTAPCLIDDDVMEAAATHSLKTLQWLPDSPAAYWSERHCTGWPLGSVQLWHAATEKHVPCTSEQPALPAACWLPGSRCTGRLLGKLAILACSHRDGTCPAPG